MQVKGIGINADDGRLGGRLPVLEGLLQTATEIGYSHVEISVYGLGPVINGRLHKGRAAQIKQVTSRYNLGYSAHGPCELNLCLDEPRGVAEQALGAYLEFCAEIGASVYVYHSGLVNLHEPYWGLTGLPSAEEMARRRDVEVEALQRLGQRAKELGVVIAMENRDPHLWEVAALARAGRGIGDLPVYHAGLIIEEVCDQLRKVGHPSVGMTLDCGHAYIAAKTVGFDFLDAVSTAAPYVRHVHMHDNVGKLDGFSDSQAERQPLGQGDLHMPPGWGEIPLVELFRRLPDYNGVAMLEIRPRYHDSLDEALANTKRILQQAGKL